MTGQAKKTGYFRDGMPFNRLGRGSRPLVIFQGLMFENKPHFEVGRLAMQHRWREAWATLLSFTLRPGPLTGIQVWLASLLLSLQPPQDPSDLVITIAAEDRFSFRSQLSQVAAPTLVVAGEKDPFYTEALFGETAAGIPSASLVLYPGMGHPASGKQFERGVLAFLRAGR